MLRKAGQLHMMLHGMGDSQKMCQLSSLAMCY